MQVPGSRGETERPFTCFLLLKQNGGEGWRFPCYETSPLVGFLRSAPGAAGAALGAGEADDRVALGGAERQRQGSPGAAGVAGGARWRGGGVVGVVGGGWRGGVVGEELETQKGGVGLEEMRQLSFTEPSRAERKREREREGERETQEKKGGGRDGKVARARPGLFWSQGCRKVSNTCTNPAEIWHARPVSEVLLNMAV